MKKIIFLIILFLNLNLTNSYSNNELYEKIDLFGEVLEKIFANEDDFKPRDPRDELIVEIMRQVLENPKIDLGPDPAKSE